MPLSETAFGKRMFLDRQCVDMVRSGTHPSAWPMRLHASDPEPLRNSELLPALHIHSMLTSSIRWFATGLVVDETEVTLYYGDRFGLVASRPFDFIEDPQLLCSVVASLCNANSANLGFSPFLRFVGSPPTAGLSGTEMKLRAYARDGTAHPLTCTVDINRVRRLYNAGSVKGRATTVVPIRLCASKDARLGGSRGLKAVLKTCIPAKGHMPEDATIWAVRGRLRKNKPVALDHITDLRYAVDAPASEVMVARAFLGDVFNGTASTSLIRMMVMVAYEPITVIVEEDSFRKAFTDVVKGALPTFSFFCIY